MLATVGRLEDAWRSLRGHSDQLWHSKEIQHQKCEGRNREESSPACGGGEQSTCGHNPKESVSVSVIIECGAHQVNKKHAECQETIVLLDCEDKKKQTERTA